MATNNQLLTIGGITKEAIRLFRNSNAFLMNINRQYDDSFAKAGAKIGNQLRIRLPNDYVVRTGQAVQINATNEIQTTLTLATQMGVDLSFSSATLALDLDEFSDRILAPAVNNLAGAIASTIMSSVEGGICNMTYNTGQPTELDWLEAKASLANMSAPAGGLKAVLSPWTMPSAVSSMAGLFNPSSVISKQYVSGEIIGPALGIQDWMADQTVLVHVPGTASGITVASAPTSPGTISLTASTGGTLNAGDIITISGVNSVNRITKANTGELQQFTVRETVTLGTTATAVPVYPEMIPAGSGGAAVQYQTITANPAASAAVTVMGQSSFATGYRKNFVFHPDAVTMVTADLEIPQGVQAAARESYDGLSMRMVSQYNISTDQFITRLDVLYGYLWVRPEWACVVPDLIAA